MPPVFFSFFVPALFVWLWSTGFIGAKYGLPYAEPFTLLFIRMLLTLIPLGVLAIVMRARWPGWRSAGHVAITGILVHGCYLGGVFYAIDQGMSSGLVSLIVGLQPLVTALAAVVFLREAVSGKQWAGLVLGLVGVSLVIAEKFGGTNAGAEGLPGLTLVWAGLALIGISLGTVYQKRHGTSVDLVSGTMIQYTAAAVLFGIGALTLETRELEWTLQFKLALGWLVFGLSVSAILLLMWLIRRGAASQVASLFYLVPPVTALEAFILFDERLGPMAMAGGAVAVAGVALVVASGRRIARSS
ncbi:drug/metabolite transporter (DMT)-like permease [Marinobacter sp. MBR-99]|jgi:drug/metabolite transporter (DMT)-like permease|uniref:DMT family transporter n=1 Tax=Marinobacter sp. MBR-99 TaxID=3156461 RepID=UPI0033985180